jgi:peptide/nickel transport system permease protein
MKSSPAVMTRKMPGVRRAIRWPWPVAWPRLRWLRLLPAMLLLLLVAIGPLIVRYNPVRIAGPGSVAPDGRFWMGTDPSGLDVYSQVMTATRLNFTIAVLVMLLSTAAGIVVGLLIGMNESRRGPLGLAARGIGRFVDFAQAIPAIVIGLVMVSFFGASAMTLVVAIAMILTPIQARLVRIEVLKVRGEAFLDAARMAGTGEFALTWRHVLPNAARPAIANASVIFGVSIILTAALGFLGAGLPPPTPEWGSMIARGATDAAVGRWWSATFPFLALIFSVVAVSLAATAWPDGRQQRR